MPSQITIVIVARNAAATIGRAVASAMAAGDHPLLLVDDGSDDATIDTAREIAGDRLRVETCTGAGVGAARQYALEATETDFGLWLDADDEILPTRPGLFLSALEDGADLVFDSGRLIDGDSGEDKGKLDIPDFIRDPRFASRCIERNWYPLLHAGFRTAFARKVGYDTTFRCGEDYDFLLRAITADARITNLDYASYRYYHFANSISRNVAETRAHVSRALGKHSLPDWAERLTRAGILAPERDIVLASSALYRGDGGEALSYLARVRETGEILPQYGLSAKIMARFLKATAHMQRYHWDAALEVLESLPASICENMPEALNNMGVCLLKVGEVEAGRALMQDALDKKPGYYDARRNLDAFDDGDVYITTHPFRREASRDSY